MTSLPSSSGSALTRQCSHSSDLPSLSPSSALTSHRSFSFIRSPSFGSKPRAALRTTTIPESDKEPIFDEIRDCDEAPYPQTKTKPLSPSRGPKAESNNNLTVKKSPGRRHRSNSTNGATASQPHKHKWMNKLDPRFDAKLLEEQRRRVEKEEKDRRKKKEEGMIEDLMPKWVQ
ncbi:hypothetical protein PISL3812_05458 [Talaromyces islandicus]|uniref:Uncharacterized protein n=1 Tax=Talaromyces islandicus TaxID=28573 RepID=A0A0U1LYK8_TALIS|nr:hypothetical protein PISL3812_05458 [Talaromyces islandicus]